MKQSALRILIFLMCFAASLSAQTNNEELDRKYTPNQNSIFNTLYKKPGQSSSGDAADIKNAIKYTPTFLFRQKLLFSYEREITDGVSVIGGLGKAFGDDIFQSVYFTTRGFDTYEPEVMNVSQLVTNSEYYSSSPLLSASVRLYFEGTTFEESFIELNYRRETLRYKMENRIDNQYVLRGDDLAELKMNQFAIGYGFAGLAGRNDNVTHEFVMYLGLKNFTYTEFRRYEVMTGSFISDYYYEKTPLLKSARVLPSVNLSYTFGFGF